MDVIDLAREFSIETWEKLTFSETLPSYIKINEEGMTIDLLYKLAKDKSMIILDKSITDSEKDTGADFFWIIRSKGGKVYRIAFQAKRNYEKSGNYTKLNYTIEKILPTKVVVKLQQKDVLKDYCKRKNYDPFYIFYNGHFSNMNLGVNLVHLDEEFKKTSEYSLLGSTVIPLDSLETELLKKNKKTLYFSEICENLETRSLQQFISEKINDLGNGLSGGGGGGPKPRPSNEGNKLGEVTLHTSDLPELSKDSPKNNELEYKDELINSTNEKNLTSEESTHKENRHAFILSALDKKKWVEEQLEKFLSREDYTDLPIVIFSDFKLTDNKIDQEKENSKIVLKEYQLINKKWSIVDNK